LVISPEAKRLRDELRKLAKKYRLETWLELIGYGSGFLEGAVKSLRESSPGSGRGRVERNPSSGRFKRLHNESGPKLIRKFEDRSIEDLRKNARDLGLNVSLKESKDRLISKLRTARAKQSRRSGPD